MLHVFTTTPNGGSWKFFWNSGLAPIDFSCPKTPEYQKSANFEKKIFFRDPASICTPPLKKQRRHSFSTRRTKRHQIYPIWQLFWLINSEHNQKFCSSSSEFWCWLFGNVSIDSKRSWTVKESFKLGKINLISVICCFFLSGKIKILLKLDFFNCPYFWLRNRLFWDGCPYFYFFVWLNIPELKSKLTLWFINPSLGMSLNRDLTVLHFFCLFNSFETDNYL
jgi:hypothetical protein